VISNPFKEVPAEIVSAMNECLPAEDAYHEVHKRRTARTVQLLLEKKPTGKLLELGTSEVVPKLLSKLKPELEVHVTDFNNPDPQEFVYSVDLETEALPVPDATFDVVLCCEVIEHMEVDPMFMMAEINRVLKQEGLLILTTPNITSSRALYKMLRGDDPYFYMQYRHKPALYRHNYEYSVSSIKKVLKAAGFSGRVWSEDTFEDPVLDDVDKLRNLGYLLPDVGDNIFAVVTKIQPVVNRYPQHIYAD